MNDKQTVSSSTKANGEPPKVRKTRTAKPVTRSSVATKMVALLSQLPVEDHGKVVEYVLKTVEATKALA